MMSYLKGGEFLVKETEAKDIFIRSEFEDQKMMLKATEDFNNRDIRPNLMRFEEKDYALVESLMRKAGELGLLGITVPENTKDLEWDLIQGC